MKMFYKYFYVTPSDGVCIYTLLLAIEIVFNLSFMVSNEYKVLFRVFIVKSEMLLLIVNAIKYPFHDLINFICPTMSSNFGSLLFNL